jgi:hypothetical protein
MIEALLLIKNPNNFKTYRRRINESLKEPLVKIMSIKLTITETSTPIIEERTFLHGPDFEEG